MSFDVGIIGGGLMGLACARELAQRGATVAVFDRGQPGREASWAGAGMLGAQCEAARYPPSVTGDGAAAQQAMFEMCLRSRATYPDYGAALLEETGIDVELLLPATEGNDWRAAGMDYIATVPGDPTPERLLEQRALGQRVDNKPLAALVVPPLTAAGASYIHLPDEGQVENRRLVEALEAAARRAGAAIYAGHTVDAVRADDSRITGVVVSGDEVSCGQVLLCAGAWSGPSAHEGGIAGLPPECRPQVRPVAGQIVMVRSRALRRILYSSNAYLVPRRDGRLLIGATMEEVGFEKRTTPEAAERLLREARRLVPDLAGAPVEGHWSGLRPGSRDGLPILGATPLGGLFIATGHFRNGILLTPVTAEILADCMLEGAETPHHFRVDRFAAQPV